VSFLRFLFWACHETTMALFSHGAEVLANDAALRHRLDADRELVNPFVEEVLRTRSPLQRLLRRVTQLTTIGGMEIPEGAMVCLLLGAANRDHDRYPTSGELHLGAADASHLAFGQGIHHCLGAPLAHLEGRIGFGALLDRPAGGAVDADRPATRFAGSTTSEYQTTTLHLRVTAPGDVDLTPQK
jgi:cytochrome P450 family 144